MWLLVFDIPQFFPHLGLPEQLIKFDIPVGDSRMGEGGKEREKEMAVA